MPAQATTRLIVDTVDHGIAGKAQIVISEGRVRLTHSGMPRQEVLFISDNREVYFIRHARKELTRVDLAVLRQSIDQFSYGVSDRGASIRVPASVPTDGWVGRLEDRRHASNGDPYKIGAVIILTTKSVR